MGRRGPGDRDRGELARQVAKARSGKSQVMARTYRRLHANVAAGRSVSVLHGHVRLHRAAAHKQSYAVTLLIDQSGSMGGQKIVTARVSLALQAEMLSKLQIPFPLRSWASRR